MSNDNNDTEQTVRLPTGIAGLDTVLKGGVFRGGIHIVQGAPGAGKTIFGNHVCFTHARTGGRALYVTLLAESHARMLAHLRRMSFFDEAAIPDRVTYLGAFKTLEDEGLPGLMNILRREVRARGATLLVLDGLMTVSETGASNLELKKFVHELQTQAGFMDCTMYLLTSAVRQPPWLSPEQTMVDGLIELDMQLIGRRAEREIIVHKLRGGAYLSGKHSFRITGDGIIVFPRIEALLAEPSRPDRADGSKISTGIAGLDAMLGGGGPSRHSVTLLTGAAGSGKTTLGLQFLGASTEDEPGLFFGFHENPTALRIKSKALNLPIDAMVEQGRVEIMWRPATEAVLDEVCAELLVAVRRRKVRRLFIDGFEGFDRLTTEKARVGPVLAALCNELRALGVTTIGTTETEFAEVVPGHPLAGLSLKGLSPLAENIVVLRLTALRSEIHRLIAVVKARDAKIDMRLRRFEIGQNGIEVELDFVAAEAVLRELLRQGQSLEPGTTDRRPPGE